MASPSDDSVRRAIAAIDLANSEDPNRLLYDGEERPKEWVHSELVSRWVAKLSSDPSPALRLAARAHHIRRWQIPRSEYPPGRGGYLRWRKSLQQHHAREVTLILEAEGFDDATIRDVEDLVQKRGLGRNSEVQILEDALCLVFLEAQFSDLAEKLTEEKLLDVTRKTVKKMSAEAIARAQDLPLSPGERELLVRALDA